MADEFVPNVIDLELGDDEEPQPEKPEVEDIDVAEWLEVDESLVIGHATVKVGGKERRLKIAGLTETEVSNLMKPSSRPGKDGKSKVNFQLNKLLTIAYSINKANGQLAPGGGPLPGGVQHTALQKRLSGSLTEIYRAITELSGFDDQTRRQDAGAFLD